MTTPDPTPEAMDHLKQLGIAVGAVAGTIGLIKLIFGPLIDARKRWKEAHPPYRKTVLRTLKELKDYQSRFDDYNAAMLRERLESAYTVYVLEMGWCPASEKRNLQELFEIYENLGWNHIDSRNREIIMSLPESKDKRIGRPTI